MQAFQLAQANVALMRAPLDDPLMADFVALLEPVNHLADASPGFVWRLQTEDGDSTGIQAFDDPRLLFNMSVWESLETLREFVYKSQHLEAFKQRSRWFEPLGRLPVALWWVPAGQRPDAAEGRARLERLWREGPTSEAFSFPKSFAPPAITLEQGAS